MLSARVVQLVSFRVRLVPHAMRPGSFEASVGAEDVGGPVLEHSGDDVGGAGGGVGLAGERGAPVAAHCAHGLDGPRTGFARKALPCRAGVALSAMSHQSWGVQVGC